MRARLSVTLAALAIMMAPAMEETILLHAAGSFSVKTGRQRKVRAQ
ncbi:hypothetical protein V1286_006241 [Bradyrhizobium algeriense]|uniref:Uncharacterized protein n=1 Tax=Bradyrhizobium algeriense TaxID=634784 RepID=A0ABU8BKT1_9BRAD